MLDTDVPQDTEETVIKKKAMKKYVSKRDTSVTIQLSDEVREHVSTHFDKELPGSKFAVADIDTLLQMLLDLFPEKIKKAKPDDDGRKRLSFSFPFDIGTCNVVSVDRLSDQENETMHRMQRGTKVVRVVESERVFPTDECQLVLSGDNNVITIYPGEAAPPLPDSPDIVDPYWDKHVFIAG